MSEQKQTPSNLEWLRHDMDPDTFRKDGKRRTGIGRFLYRIGKDAPAVVKGAALGVLDGIPGVSQVVSTITADKKVNGFAKAPRILFGWATVAVVAMSFAMKLTGHIDAATMLKIILTALGL